MTDTKTDNNTTQSTSSTMTTHTDAIDFAKVRLPSFWPNNPATWFIQAEAQFSVFKISKDETKYCLTIAALPAETCESVIDIIAEPPIANKYTTLKTTLITRHSASESKRLETLLEKVELGDRKPSALFRSMKQTAGGTFDQEIIKKLWLRRLPQALNIALVSVGDKPTDDLISIADKIFEATEASSSINTISNNFSTNSQQNHTNNNLEQRLSRLENMISNLQLNNNGDRRNKHFSNNRGRSRSNSRPKETDKNLCFYHRKFGNKALKCACTKVLSTPNSTPSVSTSKN